MHDIFWRWEIAHISLDNLVKIIVSLPAAALIYEFEASLEVVDCKCLEGCSEGMADPWISILRVAIFHSSVDEERLEDMRSGNGVKNRKMLGTEVDDRHRLPVVTKDMSPETEFAGVVNSHLDQWDTATSQEKCSGGHAVDGR